MAARNHTQDLVTVYGLASSEDGKIRYVGQTKYPLSQRLGRHLADARRVKRRRALIWIRAVERRGFRLVAFVIDAEAVWCETEIRLIAWYRRHGAALLNQTLGGEGRLGPGRKGQPKPAGFGAKISAARKGKPGSPMSDAAKAKISAFNAGKTLSAAHRAKIADANRGKRLSPAHRKQLSSLKSGKRLDLTPEQEARRKLAAANASGRPEARAKRSASMKAALAKKRLKHCGPLKTPVGTSKTK